QRLSAFLNPWASPLEEGYQLIQSYYSLGSGGLFGLGLFNSRQKYMFLPFAESDFIFSIIGEETGLIGCLLVMLLFVFLLYRGIFIATKAKSRFESYLATGIVTMIAVQTAVNVAVVCGAVPPTGLPLPFISSGGTSLVAYLSAVGLLLSVSRRGTEKFLLP
ncbi:MAG: FtsW/RodA/SpoVE family cell cycle protein, partial [Clostridiales bacterium]|nr:FtsW/RodA/SpoVE family cell cycle protein [Clostridiales bacterium]